MCRAVITIGEDEVEEGGDSTDEENEDGRDDEGKQDDGKGDDGAKEDVVDKSRGIVLFMSDHAKQRMLMSPQWQQDGTFKTVNVPFFRQVLFHFEVLLLIQF